jgi:hypothetical protein
LDVATALTQSIIQLFRFDELEFNAASPGTVEEFNQAIDEIDSAQELNRSLGNSLKS